jgi:hypothetical protein
MIDADLGARLADLEDRVTEAVERFRTGDPNPDDPFRGLYLSDQQADDLLQNRTGPADDAGRASLDLPDPSTRLGGLARRFDLTPADVDIIVAVLAPDLDTRFERLYGYLHDDLSRRRAGVALALELSGLSTFDPDARGRLLGAAPLVAHGLVVVEEPTRPFLTRSLRIPDRVTAHLLGDDRLDGELADVLVIPSNPWGDYPARIDRALTAGVGLYLHEPVESGASGSAAAGLVDSGCRGAVVVDLERCHPDDVADTTAAAIRESRLTGSGLVAVNADRLPPTIIRTLTGGPVPTVLVGRTPWDPQWSDTPVHSIEVRQTEPDARQSLWGRELERQHLGRSVNPPGFPLGPDRIRRAVATAKAAADERDEPLGTNHLALGARAQNSAGLARLARRIEPVSGWKDLVVDEGTLRQLEHLTARVAHRTRVLDDWGLRRGGGRGEGVIALFAGESGTGKTLAAEIIAHELHLDLYVIDLSTVIDKYIGETEKNLDRIFTEAEGVNGILFFDEADALFGKRTEVSDARDRYANVEVAYLLQRLESFDGLGVLATNLRANIDDAFARRLSVTIEFREPDVEQRHTLWTRLAARSPIGPTVDHDFLAESFELSGGNIRNVVVSAAYLAAADGGPVEMHHLIRGTEIEYRKLGRLCTESEFGPYHHLLESSQEHA